MIQGNNSFIRNRNIEFAIISEKVNEEFQFESLIIFENFLNLRFKGSLSLSPTLQEYNTVVKD